ncbi:hypothetical protein [Saccharothrix sp. ST-888]|uniref:hypothetical protein n=1 Tax=Saccharothrix sp. ST-888 TaxID=1427391 RepID=UPI0005ECA96C|nr:hypothetical protein [Saccharothrix sp. ST-888]KJK56416.1 hypothetical protein UK12_22620 [Saccharothrix sp. ST-888]
MAVGRESLRVPGRRESRGHHSAGHDGRRNELAFNPPTASASSYGCSGNLVDTYDIKTNGGTGTKYGELNLYYSSANGGTNCAVAVDTHFGSGVTKYQGVWIWRCTAGSSAGDFCEYDQSDYDDGTFAWYAGPATVTGTAGRCIRLFGRIDNPTSSATADASTLATHCGQPTSRTSREPCTTARAGPGRAPRSLLFRVNDSERFPSTAIAATTWCGPVPARAAACGRVGEAGAGWSG